MIPIGDNNPRRFFPIVTLSLIIINILVFAYEFSLGPKINIFINQFGLIPSTAWLQLGHREYPQLALTVLTATFSHASWLHLGGNMLYLWVFGDNVEDRLGHGRFLIFYLACAFIAMAANIYSIPQSAVPTVGASGAIAGVLGAYLVSFPRARVTIIVPLILFFPIFRIPAVVVLGFWFAIQVLSGLSTGQMAAGVAWWAHIGGFVAGAFLVNIFRIGISKKGYRH